MNEVDVHEQAIVHQFMFCHQVYMVTMVNESIPLGRKSVIVEIDESNQIEG